MEQSKLISGIIARFKVAYPYYFKDLSKEEILSLVAVYQEELAMYNQLTLTNAAKSIIRKSKFMPSLKELIDECEEVKTYNQNLVVEKMIKSGYFKMPDEIDKTYKFIEAGTIPNWLLKDMVKYGYSNQNFIENNDKKYLNC